MIDNANVDHCGSSSSSSTTKTTPEFRMFPSETDRITTTTIVPINKQTGNTFSYQYQEFCEIAITSNVPDLATDTGIPALSTKSASKLTKSSAPLPVQESNLLSETIQSSADVTSTPTAPESTIQILLYLILVLHGIGAFLPANMLIDASGYFQYKLNQSTIVHRYVNDQDWDQEPNETDVKLLFGYIAILSGVANVAMQAWNIFYSISQHNRIKTTKLVTNGGYSLSARIQMSLRIQIGALLSFLMLTLADTSEWSRQTLFIALTVSTVSLHSASGVFQSCLFASAAQSQSNRYINALAIGSSLNGVLLSLFNIASIWSIGSIESESCSKIQTSMVYYLVMSIMILTACLVAEFTYNHCTKDKTIQTKQTTSIDRQLSNSTQILIFNDEDALEDEEMQKPDESINSGQIETSSGQQSEAAETALNKWNSFWKLLTVAVFRVNNNRSNAIWPHLINIVLVNLVTFQLFPAVIANIRPEVVKSGGSFMNLTVLLEQQQLEQLPNHNNNSFIIPLNYFTSVTCFLSFWLFTAVGNIVAHLIPIKQSNISSKQIVILSLLRIGFVPFFIYCCNYIPANHHQNFASAQFNPFGISNLSVSSNWIYGGGVIALAISGGYLLSCTLMNVVQSVRPTTTKQQETIERNQTSSSSSTTTTTAQQPQNQELKVLLQAKFQAEIVGMLAALAIVLAILIGVNCSQIFPQLI